MKLSYLTFGLALFLISVLCTVPDIPSSSIPTFPILLINLYHPKCTRCKNANLQMNKLHELSANRQYEVAQINCAKQTKFCDQLKRSYPAVFLYVEGHQIIYQGQITAEDLDKWMQNNIQPSLTKLTPEDLKEKEGRQQFLLVGGLNITEKIQIGAVKATRYIGIEFYEIQSTEKVFSLYVTDQQKKLDLTFPINTRLFAYELFHRTRDHVMSVDKPEYLEYFRKQDDSDSMLILYDHHDKLTSDSAAVLDTICFELVLDVLCFKVQKQSEYYQELVGNFVPFNDRSSFIFSKKSKKRGYMYRDQQFNQTQFKKFIREAKGNKRTADFDYIQESKDRMKSQNVLNIDDVAHQQLIKNTTVVFVEYYSPFFKNCSDFVSQYDTVGQHFKSIGSSVLITSVDVDEQLALADDEGVSNKLPAFKIFIGGQGFHYRGEITAEAIINYITQITSSKLLIAPRKQDVRRPAVAISGINQSSTLQMLPAFYNSLPFYWITGDQNQKISLLRQNGGEQVFTGQITFESVLEWLQEQTGPVLVSLGDSNVPKKLKAAMKKNKPILGLINKGNQGSVESALKFLTKYCQNKKDIICGVAQKGEDDYESLVKWISDTDETANRLVWIDHSILKAYILNDDIKNLSAEVVDKFISGIEDGSIKAQEREKTQEELDQEDSAQEENQEIIEQPVVQQIVQSTEQL